MADRSAEAPFPVKKAAATPTAFRVDIQLLRALAIILVLLHHARVPGISGGFLGVDIFFVISGYLMTGIIARELEQGRFTFGGFYARRIRRLLPAAYAMLTVTAIAAPFLLDAFEYHDFLQQLMASFGFIANVVLWKQADYFNTGAALKPLLHMWSLAIEEQYYLLLPPFLFLCPSRLRLGASVMLVLVSGILCAIFIDRSAFATFYLLPFRAWELGIGSVVALLVLKGWITPKTMPVARILAAIVVLGVPWLCDQRHHPGIPALAVCLATAVLIVPGLDLRKTIWSTPLVAVGDRSYSLYLVHWPLFALANNVMLFPPPPMVNAMLLIAAFIWTEVQYRLIEQPLRTMRIDPRNLILLLVIPLAVVGLSLMTNHWFGAKQNPARAYNFGLSSACDLRSDFAFQPECQTGALPQTLIWGDSFAVQLVDGVVASSQVPVAQATRTVCGPFLGIAPTDGAGYATSWAKRCVAFNDSVIDALAKAPHVQTVVLSSSLAQYVPGAEPGWSTLVRQADGTQILPQDRQLLFDGLSRTVAAVRALGKRVVLVAPPPARGYDIARCHDRIAEGKPMVPALTSCDFSIASYRAYRAPNLAFLAEVERRGIVPIFRFDAALCPGGQCVTVMDGTLLYRDSGHLSVPGSRMLGPRLDMARQLTALAR